MVGSTETRSFERLAVCPYHEPSQGRRCLEEIEASRLALHHLGQVDDPQAAASAAIQALTDKVNGLGGVIVLSPDGRPG